MKHLPPKPGARPRGDYQLELLKLYNKALREVPGSPRQLQTRQKINAMVVVKAHVRKGKAVRSYTRKAR